MENITYIKTTFKNTLLNLTYVASSSLRDHLIIDTKNINKQTNYMYINKQKLNNNCACLSHMFPIGAETVVNQLNTKYD